MRLSAVVVTQNEEKNIERCLESLRFADEIVVVDAGSVDMTVEIAERCGARVIERRWDGFATQKQFAIEQARGEWVFLVDSDEEVSGDLAGEITQRLSAGIDASVGGFRVPRSNFFLGKHIPYGPWADDRQVRLFRKSSGQMVRRPVHEGVQTDGEVLDLSAPLFHYTHQSLFESFRRLNRYTTLEAGERVDRRKIGLADVVVLPAGVFMRYYVSGRCYKAGVHGFLLSATTAMYRSILYLKIYLLQRERS
jgi:glycosyltransferase involved in cell wall biosynthesis